MSVLGRLGRRHPRLVLLSQLSAPVAWLLVIYIGSLVLLVAAALFKLDTFSSKPTNELTGENLRTAFTTGDFLAVVVKSVGVASAVTMLCFALALPMAFYIAKIAKPWARRGLIVAVLMPLWAGYLVKGYAWKAML